MDRRRLLRRISQGHVHNVRFDDLTDLVVGLGFELHRISGIHQIYVHPPTQLRLNLQPERGRAKGYQVRQLLRYIDRYDLGLEAE